MIYLLQREIKGNTILLLLPTAAKESSSQVVSVRYRDDLPLADVTLRFDE